MIGNSPNAAPSVAEPTACPTGIPYAAIATTSATPRAIRAAHCAFIFTTPRSTKMVNSGSREIRADQVSDPATGSKIWVYMGDVLVFGVGQR